MLYTLNEKTIFLDLNCVCLFLQIKQTFWDNDIILVNNFGPFTVAMVTSDLFTYRYKYYQNILVKFNEVIVESKVLSIFQVIGKIKAHRRHKT